MASLAIGNAALGAWLLAVSIVCAFLSHESILVRLGQRGVRATREQTSVATRSLLVFGGFGAIALGAALMRLPSEAIIWLGLPALFAAASAVLIVRGRERTTVGEVLIAAALASSAVPVAIAGGESHAAALTVFLVFASIAAAATVAVRSVIGRVSKAGGPSSVVAVAFAASVVIGLALLAWQRTVAPVAPWAALPVCVVAVVLSVWPPSPRHLRRVGWTLVAANALTLVIAIVGLM